LPQALQAFEQAEAGWQGLDEAGEFYAHYAIASHLAGKTETACEILERAHQNVDESWISARLLLEFADAIIAGQPFDDKLTWFNERGFVRWVDFIQKNHHLKN